MSKSNLWVVPRSKLWLLPALAASLLVAPEAKTQLSNPAFIYNVGPNHINQSGSSCRAESRAVEKSRDVNHYAGQVNIQGSTVTRLYCPLQRRSTTFYGVSGSDTRENRLDMTGVEVGIYDGTSLSAQSCTGFRRRLDTGSVSWTAARFACSTVGGCASSPGNSYTGTTSINLASPDNTTKTLNYGVFCDLRGPSGQVLYLRGIVNPNP